MPFYDLPYYAKIVTDELPFLRHIYDPDVKKFEGEYTCIRCLLEPDSVQNLKDDNYFDRVRFGLKPKALYRYRNGEEIKQVLQYRYKKTE